MKSFEASNDNCLKCETWINCPYTEVAFDGSYVPPINCPYYTERMKQIEKLKKKHSKGK